MLTCFTYVGNVTKHPNGKNNRVLVDVEQGDDARTLSQLLKEYPEGAKLWVEVTYVGEPAEDDEGYD